MSGKNWLPQALLNPKQKPSPRRAHNPRALKHRNRKTAGFREHGRQVGAWLRASRWRDGRNGRGLWTLRGVAQRAEINFAVLSQIETGKRRPAADDLIHLADVLGEDREELLVRAGYLPASALANRGRFNLSAAERELIERVRARPGTLGPLTALAPSA